MDWDDLAWRVTGPEGGDRYVRLGIALVVLGVVAMAAVGFTPIYRSDDVSLTYDMMAEDPDDDSAFGVPNSQALAHANWALVGAFLTMAMGLVLVLEGKRVVNLRRLLVWHAEARATALFSLAAALSSLGLLAGASLLGLAESMPTGSGAGVTVMVQANSPAAIVVVATMGLATAGMMGMAYYSSVLSVYRGGGDPVNRKMVRFSMLLAFLSLGGVLLLRLGVIMMASIEWAVLGMPDTITVDWYYTMSRIDHQATLGAGEETKGTLDLQLTIGSGLLFLSALCGLAGLVGVSARSLGGASLRVRRATALPAVGLAAATLALLFLAWAASTAPSAVQESWGIDDLEVSLGWGLYAGVVLALAALACALGYMGGLGMAEAREVLAPFRKAKPLAGTPEDEGIPQPMVEQALEEEARARGEFPPMEPEAPKPPLRERLLLQDARRNQVVIGVAIVAIIILVAVLWPGGPGGGNGNGGQEDVEILDLPTFSEDLLMSDYLVEGDDMLFNALSSILMVDPGTTVYFVDQVSLRLIWQDEADAGVLWTNTPDTFEGRLEDDQGLDSARNSGANPTGGGGSMSLLWDAQGAWFAVGGTDLVDWGDQPVYTDSEVSVSVMMVDAGDQVTPLGRTQADDGNAFTLMVTVSGHVFTKDPGGQ